MTGAVINLKEWKCIVYGCGVGVIEDVDAGRQVRKSGEIRPNRETTKARLSDLFDIHKMLTYECGELGAIGGERSQNQFLTPH